MDTNLARRCARGAALLDHVRPGWAQEIAVDRLAMESCDRCILGQLWGHYEDGFRELLRPLDSRILFSSADHGFTLFNCEQTSLGGALPRFAALTDAWRITIWERLARGGCEEGDTT